MLLSPPSRKETIECMDNFAKIMIVAYENWRRRKSKAGEPLTGTPEELRDLFINDITK
jgi:hypothetical protein